MKKYLAVLFALLASCDDTAIQNFGEEKATLTITEARAFCEYDRKTCKEEEIPLFRYTGRYHCGKVVAYLGFHCFPNIEFTSNEAYTVGQELKISLQGVKK